MSKTGTYSATPNQTEEFKPTTEYEQAVKTELMRPAFKIDPATHRITSKAAVTHYFEE